MKRNEAWGSRLGFYLVAIGSACGLGNLWRFPYVVGENGGGAFILLYIFVAIVIGAPLLINELILGKFKNQPLMKALSTPIPGALSVLMSLIVLSYYSIISGWVLKYIFQLVLGKHLFFEQLGPVLVQFIYSLIHISFAVFVVMRGVHSGLEKWIKIIMPSFGVLMIYLVSKSMSLEATPDVLRYLFYPDFSKLKLESLNHAVGHVFFTLSVGFGSMVTFGAYLSKDMNAPIAGFRIAFIDTLISLVAVMLIFPIAFSASDVPLTDPSLMFRVLPSFLLNLNGGWIWALVFFLCLYFAALSATIGLFENVVSNRGIFESYGLTRRRAAAASGLIVFLLGIIPSIWGAIEDLDSVLINWILPMVAFIVLYFSRKSMNESNLESEFLIGKNRVRSMMYPYWSFVVSWLAPSVIIFGLSLQLIGLFKSWSQ